MSIESAKFIVQRGADQFSCRGDELIDKLQPNDLMVVQHDSDDEASCWRAEKPMAWEAYKGYVWHVRNASDRINLKFSPYKAWDANTEQYLGEIDYIYPGDDVVFATGNRAYKLFYGNNFEFELGPYTNTKKVVSFESTFHYTSRFKYESIRYLHTNSAQTLKQMWAYSFPKDLDDQPGTQWFDFVDMGHFDTSNVTDFSGMFFNAHAIGSVNTIKWNLSSATNMSQMFQASYYCEDISNWDVSNVENMDDMFRDTLEPEFRKLDLSPWNTKNVKFMNRMFMHSGNKSDLSQWCVPKIQDEPIYFNEDGNLTGIPVWGTCPRGEDQ